jgi:hypothetical protein
MIRQQKGNKKETCRLQKDYMGQQKGNKKITFENKKTTKR